MSETINLKLRIWRQRNASDKGRFEIYDMPGVSTHMSFLEMMDVLNDRLIKDEKDPVAFDHDCREGICGMCSMYINGRAHGPLKGTTVCQLHMRHFHNDEMVTIEPWRAEAFPVIKDLAVDRSAFENIMQAGGYISVNTGNAVDANALPIEKAKSDEAFDAAACIGCGACVAACKNASAMLFMAAKVSQLALLPQGEPERNLRVLKMMEEHDDAGFGSCTNTGACEAECPKEISISHIARLNREYVRASLVKEK
jgi:succinate dehydrogenase / fumarate reductase iron-sulfur subunit